MNTTQIVAEAAETICKLVVAPIRKNLAFPTPQVEEIIQTAIEKVFRENVTAYLNGNSDDMITEILDNLLREHRALEKEISTYESESHAAHASEVEHRKSIVGSCTCLTKTPEVKYHKPDCRYRQIMESRAAHGREQGEVNEAHRVLGALVRALDAGALSMNPSTLLTDIRVAFKKLDDALPQRPTPATDLLELAWGIIANAGGGDWDKESREWQDAAIRWRDTYFGSLANMKNEISEQPNTHRPPNAPATVSEAIADIHAAMSETRRGEKSQT